MLRARGSCRSLQVDRQGLSDVDDSPSDGHAEAALAHAIGNKIEVAYRRGDLFEKHRMLMKDWTAFATSPANTPLKSTDEIHGRDAVRVEAQSLGSSITGDAHVSKPARL